MTLDGPRKPNLTKTRLLKRLIGLVTPIFILIGFLIGLSVSEARRPPEWQQALNRYFASGSPSVSPVLRTVSRAAHPETFTPAMAKFVFADDAWRSTELPLPPESVWCVLLAPHEKQATPANNHFTEPVIFVAYHNDQVWQAGWAVYTLPENQLRQTVQAHLDLLGCKLY